MKKITLILLTLCLAVSSGFAAKVETANARMVARSFIFERSGIPFQDIMITSEATEQENGNALYYIFGINNNGFIIVSADDACYPVIGYSLASPFFGGDIPDHFAFWMEHYKAQIRLAIDTRLQADAATSEAWNHFLTNDHSSLNVMDAPTDVSPLITSMWNQDFPWNAMCPEDNCVGGRVPVGCVATAMTQIMHYWRHPITGSGQHCIFPQPSAYGPQCADFGATTYQWNAMTNSMSKECDPVAELSWHGGISVDMDYDCDGSGAQTAKVPLALRTYFKYSNSALFCQKMFYSTSDWNTILRNDLDAKQPIEYSGQGSDGGHAWVCDGYQGTDYFHMNWGWGGYGNGYFYLNNLNPPGYTFNQDQTAVIHIIPDASYSTGCSGTTVIDAWDFGSFEDGSGPVADYLNNQNCSWLIAPDDSVANITLSFIRFNTASGDEVKVYDGTSSAATLIGTYSGSSVPSDITSSGPALFVTFTSNSSGTAQGWLAEFTASTIEFCDGTTFLTEAAGDISDGSGNFNYRNSTTCKWKIQPTNAATITLSFDNFSTETDNDKLQVYDLGSGSLLELLTGDYTTPPDPITCPSGQMMLIFQSNKTVRGEGFSSSYTITTGTGEDDQLQGLIVYPNPASDRITVRFNSSAVQQMRIELIAMNGTTLLQKQFSASRDLVTYTLDIQKIPQGIYLLRITGHQGVSNTKIVIE